jgi:plasmid stability protein
MAILQIKGIDDALYSHLKQMAAADNRSVSQEVLHLTKEYMVRREAQDVDATSVKTLLELAGSWDDDRDCAEVARAIRAARRNSDRSPAL